jgi:predicted AlkP superfamily phosphohydrolase/phosphomutase
VRGPARHARTAALLALAAIAAVAGCGAPREPLPKLFVLGLDGASWAAIEPLVAAGRMPNLARVRERGAHGVLRSVEAYVSPPAWTTLFCGYTPEHTGIHTFGPWSPARQSFRSHVSSDVRKQSLWDVASRHGLRVAVANVPVTYPATPVNGLMLAGLMTPGKTPEPPPAIGPVHCAGSTPVTCSAESAANRFEWSVPADPDTAQPIVLRVSDRTAASERDRELRVAPGTYSAWFPVGSGDGAGFARARIDGGTLRFSGVHRNVPPDFAHPRALGAELAERFVYYSPTPEVREDVILATAHDAREHVRFLLDREDWDLFVYVFAQTDMIHHSRGMDAEAARVYEVADAVIGDVWRALDGRGVLAVVSDHGFADYALGVDLNRVLERLGWVRWRGGAVDTEHSLVFHNFWHLYFDEARLDAAVLAAHGVTPAAGQSPRDALAARLREQLATAVVDARGAALPIAVTPLPPASDPHEPDMVVQGTYARHLVEYWGLTRPRDVEVFALEGWQRNHHHRDGVVVFAGPGIRAGMDLGVRAITDVAPTLYRLLDLPLAADFDGATISAALDATWRRAHPVQIVAGYPAPAATAAAPVPETRPLEDKLRSLGYAR